jgi:hypothetical protein
MSTRFTAPQPGWGARCLLWSAGAATVAFLAVTTLGVVCLALAIALDDRVAIPGLVDAWMARRGGRSELRFVPNFPAMTSTVVVAAGLGALLSLRGTAS